MLDLLRGIIALAEERPMDVRLQRLAEEARGIEAQGWQPIETAPRDGTRVDIWDDGGRIPNAFWESGRWTVYSHSTGRVRRYHMLLEAQPTHWMPLPEPPQLPEIPIGICPLRTCRKGIIAIPIYAMDAHKPEGE